jgi:hypothetical protein
VPFQLLKFGHVVTIIAALALAEGSFLPTLIAGRRRDVQGIRAGIAVGEVGERIANPLALISIALGIAAALAGQIDLLTSWLVVAYLLLVLAVLLGVGGGFRHVARIKRAVEESPPDQASAELVALIDHPWTWLVTLGPPMLMGSIIFLMVVRPSLW